MLCMPKRTAVPLTYFLKHIFCIEKKDTGQSNSNGLQQRKHQQLAPASSNGLQQLQQQLVPASSNGLQQLLQQLVPASNNSLQQEQQPASATSNTSCSSPVTSPRMTRARKKREALSPADSVAIEQVDGADCSPPPSPAALQSPPTPPTPPPPPPWSFRATRAPLSAGDAWLAGCHGLGYTMCHVCHLKILRKFL